MSAAQIREIQPHLHWSYLLTSVFLPFGFVLVMNGLETATGRLRFVTWREKFMKIAWDSCVFALGLSGGVLSNPGVIRSLGEPGTLILAVGSILIILTVAIRVGSWRSQDNPKGFQALASLALSGGILAVYSYIALVYSAQ